MTTRGWVRPVLVVMLVGMVTQGFGRLTFSVLLPAMVGDYLGDYSTAGVTGALNLAGYLVGIVACMATGRWVGDTRSMKIGIALVVVGTALTGAAHTAAVLDVAQVICGLGCASGWLSCGGIADRLAPAGRKGLAFGLMFAGVGFGITMIGGLYAVIKLVFGGAAWRPVWWTEAVLGAVVLVLVAVTLRAEPASRGSRPETSETSAGLATGVSRPVFVILALTSLAYALFGLAHATYTTFLSAALRDYRHVSLGTAAAFFSLMGVTSAVGATVFGRVSDAVGRLAPIVVGHLLLVACAATVCNGPTFLGLASPVVYGLVMSGLPAVVTAYVYGSVPERSKRTAYATITLAVGVGNFAGPLLAGPIADTTGSFRVPFDLAAGAGTVACAVAVSAFLVSSRTRGLSCDHTSLTKELGAVP